MFSLLLFSLFVSFSVLWLALCFHEVLFNINFLTYQKKKSPRNISTSTSLSLSLSLYIYIWCKVFCFLTCDNHNTKVVGKEFSPVQSDVSADSWLDFSWVQISVLILRLSTFIWPSWCTSKGWEVYFLFLFKIFGSRWVGLDLQLIIIMLGTSYKKIFVYDQLGSVWILLILLKLKIYCWKYCR